MYLEILFITLVVLLILFIYLYKKTKEKLNNLEFNYKSMYVKHGKNWENFVPFMSNYPGDKENSVFIGNPIDFISFDDDFIKFIEVKTGKSQLSEKQRKIKELVENKKVKWYEIRFEK
ncbi:hypothetical protein HY498_00165 [Candidatus Woesearchaeota archaeon]|nr:hypothetical protein [Candidatus Woesearchaeota archaeon]